MTRFSPFAIALVLLAGCGGEGSQSSAPRSSDSPPDTAGLDAAVDELLDLMRQRLLLMHEVARWKWNAGKPIEDHQREQTLLADMEERGHTLGVSRELARTFMATQIDAGKLVQQADFKRWSEQDQGEFPQVRDLATDLRPAIDELSTRLLAHLAELTRRFDPHEVWPRVQERAAEILQGEGIDEGVRAAAIRTLVGP